MNNFYYRKVKELMGRVSCVMQVLKDGRGEMVRLQLKTFDDDVDYGFDVVAVAGFLMITRVRVDGPAFGKLLDGCKIVEVNRLRTGPFPASTLIDSVMKKVYPPVSGKPVPVLLEELLPADASALHAVMVLRYATACNCIPLLNYLSGKRFRAARVNDLHEMYEMECSNEWYMDLNKNYVDTCEETVFSPEFMGRIIKKYYPHLALFDTQLWLMARGCMPSDDWLKNICNKTRHNFGTWEIRTASDFMAAAQGMIITFRALRSMPSRRAWIVKRVQDKVMWFRDFKTSDGKKRPWHLLSQLFAMMGIEGPYFFPHLYDERVWPLFRKRAEVAIKPIVRKEGYVDIGVTLLSGIMVPYLVKVCTSLEKTTLELMAEILSSAPGLFDHPWDSEFFMYHRIYMDDGRRFPISPEVTLKQLGVTSGMTLQLDAFEGVTMSSGTCLKILGDFLCSAPDQLRTCASVLQHIAPENPLRDVFSERLAPWSPLKHRQCYALHRRMVLAYLQALCALYTRNEDPSFPFLPGELRIYILRQFCTPGAALF